MPPPSFPTYFNTVWISALVISIAEACAWADCDRVDAVDSATSRTRAVKVLFCIGGSPPRAQSASRDYTPRQGHEVGAREVRLRARARRDGGVRGDDSNAEIAKDAENSSGKTNSANSALSALKSVSAASAVSAPST